MRDGVSGTGEPASGIGSLTTMNKLYIIWSFIAATQEELADPRPLLRFSLPAFHRVRAAND